MARKRKRELLQAPHALICPDSDWGYPRKWTIEKENQSLEKGGRLKPTKAGASAELDIRSTTRIEPVPDPDKVEVEDIKGGLTGLQDLKRNSREDSPSSQKSP